MFLQGARERGFDLNFHAIRGGHATALIDAGVPVTVTAARLGHDPAVLLRRYAKRTAKMDAAAAAVIDGILGGILGAPDRTLDSWDAAAVEGILPDILKISGIDWSAPVSAWPKDVLIRFLCAAFELIRRPADVRAAIGTTAR
jgi:hypothetical protein